MLKSKFTHRLRPNQASDLVFSCIRSKLAYAESYDIIHAFENKKQILNLFNTCNSDIQKDVLNRIDKIQHKPLFYDGSSNSTRDAQGYIIWDDKRLFVTYRGTCCTKDILDNIDIRRKKIFKNIIVHQGYYEQFMSIEEDITRDIKLISDNFNIQELVFGGHSLASAISNISSPYYGQMFKNRFKITSHTCGGAAVGNIDFINWFCSNVDENIRIETEGDIVPYIPFHNDFYHVPNGIKISKTGEMQTQYEIKPYSYLKLLSILLNKQKWHEIYEDHSCENYISSLFAIHDPII
jgi:predicted lipase